MAGAPDNRGKRGLVSSLGYGYGASLDLSSLHLPLASSVLAAPTVVKTVHTSPIIRSSLPLSASLLSAPTVIKTVQSAPLINHVIAEPHVLNYAAAPSLGLASSLDLHGLGYGSAGLLNSYNLGGLPLTSHVNDLHAW